tara:strand:- start:369 stop:560 length:192 start_codon:yes stop_codon:yes gene_type:complete
MRYKVVITSTEDEIVEVEATSETEAREKALSGEFSEVTYQDNYNWSISSVEEIECKSTVRTEI